MIDLHLHLDGSLPPEIIPKLANLAHIDLPDDLSAAIRVPSNCRSLNDYLHCFELPKALLQSEEALELAAHELGCSLARQGLLYAEIRFAPQLHTCRGMSQRQAVQAVCAGLDSVNKDFPAFHAQAILCCMRGGSFESNAETIELAAEFLGQTVCAADLAGAEALFPTEDYREIFTRAAALEVPFTIHAGEAAGPESIRTAVEMGAGRIGHGVRALEDHALTDFLAEQKIPLELCYTSNLQTKAVPSPKAFPLREFMRRGVCATLNTDNLTVSGTTLRHEYALLDITPEERKTLLGNAVRAAFLPEKEKNMLLKSVWETLEAAENA